MHSKSNAVQFWCILAVLLIGLAVRLPHLTQSFWYDELTTLSQYVLQPWSKVLAAKAGDYVPNNQVFHTILAKLVYSITTKPHEETLLRLPALIAGLWVPIALVWPMRRSNPLLAITIALVTALHPWLVDFSVEARGYSLLLLLGIVSTHYLVFKPIGYVLSLTLAIYTVPLALLLVPAHAVAVLCLRRSDFLRWAKTAAIAVALAAILYAPMAHGLIAYYHNPYRTTIDYRQFLDALPRFAFTGTAANARALYWALPVIAIATGSVLGCSRGPLRSLLITFGITTVLGVALPLIIPGATEVRFVPWILPWFCLATGSVFFSATTHPAKIVAFLGIIALLSFEILQDVTMLPHQPIRDGIRLADQLAPPDADIMMLYLGARESIAIYGDQAPHHPLLAAPDVITMRAMQIKALQETSHLPWVIIFYEKLAFDRNFIDPDAHGLWTSLQAHYHLITRPPLAGRVSPVSIYAPN